MVYLDLMIYRLDGYEVTQHLRSKPITKNVAIVVVRPPLRGQRHSASSYSANAYMKGVPTAQTLKKDDDTDPRARAAFQARRHSQRRGGSGSRTRDGLDQCVVSGAAGESLRRR